MGLHTRRAVVAGGLASVALAAAALAVPAASASAERPSDAGRAADVMAYWTPERIASAQPRDLVVDARGLGYLRGRDGSLTPYGHEVRATLVQLPSAAPGSPTPKAPPSSGDNTGPTVTGASPDGATVGGSVTFMATVTDGSGIRSVSFVIEYPDGRTQAFTPTASGDVYSTSLTGFSNGVWGWYVVAKDGAGRGGNTTQTGTFAFTVNVDGGGGDPPPPPPDGTVTNSPWTSPGALQDAAGRILFEMPANKRATRWNAYVCSGTAVVDTNSGASVILTAAHCVYDDANKAFARNVLFIPNQDQTSGTGTDRNCDNDPLGCWSPSHGVVDVNWTTRTFPENVEWDYAYYVVPDSGAHTGKAAASESLAGAVEELSISFADPTFGNETHALGYSYSDDPNFMYCKEARQAEAGGVDYWLPNCDLSGGSSGGPWVAPMGSNGSGPIISVNSWGYTTQPGMAGPYLDGSAECVFAAANDETAQVTDRGVIVPGC